VIFENKEDPKPLEIPVMKIIFNRITFLLLFT